MILPKHADILAYCLIPNHFHLLVRQIGNNGISYFMTPLSISYSKYYNMRHKRSGHLFGSTFKAVFIESDDQLIHISRYIHLNPYISSLVSLERLDQYPWSSLPQYYSSQHRGIAMVSDVLTHFSSIKSYEQFINDYADYAKKLKNYKHLAIED